MNYARVSDGMTSLLFACQKSHLEVVRELCKRGANVNAATTDFDDTPLLKATQKGHLEIAR